MSDKKRYRIMEEPWRKDIFGSYYILFSVGNDWRYLGLEEGGGYFMTKWGAKRALNRILRGDTSRYKDKVVYETEEQ